MIHLTAIGGRLRAGMPVPGVVFQTSQEDRPAKSEIEVSIRVLASGDEGLYECRRVVETDEQGEVTVSFEHALSPRAIAVLLRAEVPSESADEERGEGLFEERIPIETWTRERETPNEIPSSVGRPVPWDQDEDPPEIFTTPPPPEFYGEEIDGSIATPVIVKSLPTSGCPLPPTFAEASEVASLITGDPVFPHNGEQVHSIVDLSLAAAFGPSIDFVRTSRTQALGASALGPGWDHNFNRWLVIDSATGDVTIATGSGRADTWTRSGGGFRSPAGFYAQLERGAAGDYRLQSSDGGYTAFEAGTGRMTEQVDRFGNALRLEYDPISGRLIAIRDALFHPVDNPRRGLVLRYDQRTGGLESVEDHHGRAVTYTYFAPGEPGGPPRSLKSVTRFDPVTTRSASMFYTYDALHGALATVTGPDEVAALGLHPDDRLDAPAVAALVARCALHNEFDVERRVVRQALGGPIGSPEAGVFELEYAAAETRVVDPVGDVTIFEFNGNIPRRLRRINRGLRAMDPLLPTQEPAEYIYDFGSPRPGGVEPTRIELPDGRVLEREYVQTGGGAGPEFAGRLRRMRISGGGLSKEWEFQYDFDQPGAVSPRGVVASTTTGGRATTISRDARGLPVRSEGVTTTIYDHEGPTGDTDRPWIKSTFDTNGLLVESRDSRGLVTVFERHPASAGDLAGALKRVVKNPTPSGLASATENISTEFGRDALGRVDSLRDARGFVTKTTRDGFGRLLRIDHDPSLGSFELFDYSPSGRLVERRLYTNGEWTRRRYTYDRRGQVLSISEELSPHQFTTTAFKRDGLGRVIRVSNGVSAPLDIELDARGLVYRAIRGRGTPLACERRWFYDQGGRPIRRVDPEGHVLDVEYDGLGRPKITTDRRGHQTHLDIDVHDRVVGVSIVDKGGEIAFRMENTYDELGRVVWSDSLLLDRATGRVVDRLRRSREFDTVYGRVRVSRVGGVSPGSLVRSNTYARDALGRASRISNSDGTEVHLTYDSTGHVVQLKRDLPGAEYTVERRYDARGRWVEESIGREGAPERRTTRRRFDARNLVRSVWDPRENETRYTYDRGGRLVRIDEDIHEGGDGGAPLIDTLTSLFSWDDAGRVVATIGPDGQRWAGVYDALGRITEERLPGGARRLFGYYQDSALAWHVEPDGTRIDYELDEDNRPTQIRVGSSALSRGLKQHYTYGTLGAVVAARNDSVSIVRTFDTLRRLVSESMSVDGRVSSPTEFKYDILGRMVQLNYPSGRRLTYTRNHAGDITEVTEGVRLIAEITRDEYGFPSQLALGAARFETAHALKADRSLASIRHGAGVGVVSDLNLSHDEAGRVIRREDRALGWAETIRYDSVGRVVGIERREGAALDAMELELDAIGAREAIHTTSAGRTTTTRYTTGPSGAYDRVGSDRLVHDLAGRRVRDGRRRLLHDALGRLVYTTSAQGSARYRHDPFGRLVGRTVQPRRGAAFTEIYQYAGAQCIEHLDAQGAVKRSLVPSDTMDNVLSLRAGNRDLYPLHDERGSVIGLVDDRGALVERYTYDAFGVPAAFDAAGGSVPLEDALSAGLFQGRPYEPSSGLYDFRNRSYDPENGVFTTRDLKGLWGSPTSRGNAYLAFGGDPYGRRDPLGLDDASWVDRWVIAPIQIIGGALEVAGGVVLIGAPEPLTTAGGIVMTAHGADTVIAGFRTFWTGKTQSTVTQMAAESSARYLGADESTAKWIGTGVDFAAGIGPSLGVGLARRGVMSFADDALTVGDDLYIIIDDASFITGQTIKLTDESSTLISLGYKHKGWTQIGHNIVGYTPPKGQTAFFDLLGGKKEIVNWGPFVRPNSSRVINIVDDLGSDYVMTTLRVGDDQADDIAKIIQGLSGSVEGQTWRYLGPNCTTTARQVLKVAGVPAPGWAVTPYLLHVGTRSGYFIQVGINGTTSLVDDTAVGLLGSSGRQHNIFLPEGFPSRR